MTTLEGPQRVATQKIDEVLAKLSLKPGMVVADIGAGSGLFSRPLAKAVAPTGKVYAVDIQQDLLDHINQRDKEENIRNIQTVLGEFDDPKLPAHDADLGSKTPPDANRLGELLADAESFVTTTKLFLGKQ